MKLPAAVLNTRSRYVATFPLWVMPPGPDAEERARQWTLYLVAQIVYEFPGQGYGSKRADNSRPISKDSLAQTGEGLLFNWDMLSGAGTGAPRLTDNPDGENITGQIFVPVNGLNVIGGATPTPPTPTPTPPPSGHKIPYDENKSIQFGLGCNDVYKQSGAAMDPGMISVHSMRCAWDYYVDGLAWGVAYRKHINEFRAEYGLGPV